MRKQLESQNKKTMKFSMVLPFTEKPKLHKVLGSICLSCKPATFGPLAQHLPLWPLAVCFSIDFVINF
jgi:hypothetical protein